MLAEGAYHERHFKKVGNGERSLWIESNAQSGPDKHSDKRNLMRGQLFLSFTEDGFTYMFEKTNDGLFEIKSVITDPVERYRHYKTFKPTFSEDGKLILWGINGNEIEEKEQEERDAGMYEPTVEKLDAFIKRLIEVA